MGRGEGKGEGRGRCGMLEQAAECVRCMICFACLVVCLGPILIVVGIVFLSLSDTRGDKVKQYNDAVAAWEGGEYNNSKAYADSLWLSMAHDNKLTSDSSADHMDDTHSDIHTYTSYIKWISASDVMLPEPISTNPLAGYGIVIGGAGNIRTPVRICTGSFSPGGDKCQLASDAYQPEKVRLFAKQKRDWTGGKSESEANDEGNDCRNGCSEPGSGDCGQWDQSKDGKKWRGTCTTYHLLTNYGAAVALSSTDTLIGASAVGNYVYKESEGSCCNGMYESKVTRLSNVRTITGLGAMVRSDKDPYVLALKLTDGSLDFGMTLKTKRTIGFSCLGGGICYMCVTACAMFACFKGMSKEKRSQIQGKIRPGWGANTQSYGPSGYQPVNQGQPVVGQPAYSQQQYPQQQAYEQQQPYQQPYPGQQQPYQQQYPPQQQYAPPPQYPPQQYPPQQYPPQDGGWNGPKEYPALPPQPPGGAMYGSGQPGAQPAM